MLASLPDELILKVFSGLDFHDKVILSTVSKKLHSVLRGARAWGEVRLAVGSDNFESVQLWLGHNCQDIQDLSVCLPGYHCEGQKCILDVLRSGPTTALSRLELHGSPLYSQTLSSAPDSFPALEHLALTNLRIASLPGRLQTLTAFPLPPFLTFPSLETTLTRLEYLQWIFPGDLSVLSGMSALQVLGISFHQRTDPQDLSAPLAGGDSDVLAGLRELSVLKLHTCSFRDCPLPLDLPVQCECELHAPFEGFHANILDRAWSPMGLVRVLTLAGDECLDGVLDAADLAPFQTLQELYVVNFVEVANLGALVHLRSFSWKSVGSIHASLPELPLQSLELMTRQKLVLDFEPGAAQVVSQSLVRVVITYRVCSGVGVPFLAHRSKASLQFLQVEGLEMVPRGLGEEAEEAAFTVLSTSARSVGEYIEFFRGRTNDFTYGRGFDCKCVTSEAGEPLFRFPGCLKCTESSHTLLT